MRVGYLGRSAVGAALTANALRPVPGQVAGVPAFFAGWLTAELSPHLLALTAADTAVALSRGATRSSTGRVAVALSFASAAGLVTLTQRALGTRAVVEQALAATIPAADAMSLSWRQLARPFRLRDRAITRTAGIPYGPAGFRNQLDVYRADTAEDGAPVLLQIHGGAWMTGRKDQQGLPLMMAMAARGWVCVAPNYRLSPRATYPAQLVDVKRALAWVRSNIADHGGDPGLVAVTGGSAGGHLAAMLALTPNEPWRQPGFEDVDTTVQACVPHYGVYDLANTARDRRVVARTRMLSRLVLKTDPVANRSAFEDASPICHLRPDAPPFFVVHGRHDSLVPVSEARTFAARLRATSTSPVLYAELPGAQHAFDVFRSIRSASVVAAVECFLDWVVTSQRNGVPA